MCVQFAFYHQLWINTWRSKFEHETDSIFLLVDPMDKSHKDLDVIDLSVPRHAQYLHNAWKRHQDALYWVDIFLLLRKDEHSIRLDRMQSSFKKHFQLIVSRKLLG